MTAAAAAIVRPKKRVNKKDRPIRKGRKAHGASFVYYPETINWMDVSDFMDIYYPGWRNCHLISLEKRMRGLDRTGRLPV
jgi:hypothetical protein